MTCNKILHLYILYHARPENVKLVQGVCRSMCYGERDLEPKYWTVGRISVICPLSRFYHPETIRRKVCIISQINHTSCSLSTMTLSLDYIGKGTCFTPLNLFSDAHSCCTLNQRAAYSQQHLTVAISPAAL